MYNSAYKLRNNIIIKQLLYLILIAMAVSPSFALGEDNRNQLLIAIMGLSPLIIIRYKLIEKNDILLLLFMISILFSPLIIHPESKRWSTVLYSIMFCLTFMAYSRLLRKSNANIMTYSMVLKRLMYAYAVVLLIQQFCVLTGLPIFNLGNYDPLMPWKLNSLSSEPSHSARFIGVLMYSYLVTKDILLCRSYSFFRDGKKDCLLWIAFFWTMLTMMSATAFVFMFVVFLKFFDKRNIVFFLIGVVFIIVIANVLNFKDFERVEKTVIATITLNEEKIIEADHSGSYRIVPIMLSAKEVDLSTVDGWFGNGIDHMSTVIHNVIPGTPEGYSNGGMMLVAAEYGFISFVIFLVFSLRTTIRRDDIATFFFWFVMIFSLSLNMQMLWCAVLLLYTNKYFFKIKQDSLCLNTK